MKCTRCEDIGWVCEHHDHKPWREGEGGCTCGAGAPCPSCNVVTVDDQPRLPPDFAAFAETIRDRSNESFEEFERRQKQIDEMKRPK
jgi:hypothetical protein